LQKLQLSLIEPGVIRHVLPSAAAAPLLATLLECAKFEREGCSFNVGSLSPQTLVLLADDLRALAAYPGVSCPTLAFYRLAPFHVPTQAELATVVAPLAASVRELILVFHEDAGEMEVSSAVACGFGASLTQLKELCIYCENLPDVGDLVLDHATLTLIKIFSREDCSAPVTSLLRACAVALGSVRPQGSLRVEIELWQEGPGITDAETQWARLKNKVAHVSQVEVVF
jgi:hypothetical protein